MNLEASRVRLGELDEKRENLKASLSESRDKAKAEDRDLTEDESRSLDEGLNDLDGLDKEHEKLAAEIATEEKRDIRLAPRAEQVDAAPATEARHSNARGSSKPEMIYRPNNENDTFFFQDVARAAGGDWSAAERLSKHDAELRAANTTASTAGGGFIPPIFMGDDYAEYAREARPFADVVPNRPLQAKGMTITVPRITTGTSVDDQGATENTAVSTTAIVDSPLTVGVRTIGGYNDVSQQLLERSEPGIDEIIFGDLRAAYDGKLDTFCISGTGTNQHLGIRAVTSINTVQYTDSTPTAAEFAPKLYDAIQKIASNRFRQASHIIMHPRRAAWLASNLSSTFPLFQQGQYLQAAGSQDGGFVLNVAGLPVVQDANIGTTYSDGGNTNEDEVYVVYANDLRLYEGPVEVRVDPYTVGLNLTTRIVMYAYSAFVSARFAKSITKIYGSGLATPSF